MPSSIDAAVVLGLAGKARQVFDRQGTYLSFPLAPIAIERSRFHALTADPFSPEGARGLAEFSLLVNEIPNGPVWQPEADRRLWDVYGDVLGGAKLAQTTHTAQKDTDYQKAYGLLYETKPDGSVVASPTVVAYEQYRDAYLAAAQEYNNRKGQAELAADSATRNRWKEDEPVFRQRVADAEKAWATTGRRADVEEARRVLLDLGSRSPLMVWAGYRKLFDPSQPEIFFRTALDNSTYVPTAYLPSDVVDAAWNSITVTRLELTALAAAAPEGLRARLSGGSGDAAVDVVSFEYSLVTVQRPWFSPDVFASHAWRFREPNRVLSDGAAPPIGECTAYVSGLVLARSISVRRQATTHPTASLAFLPIGALATRLPPGAPALRGAETRPVVAARAATRVHAAERIVAEQPTRRVPPPAVEHRTVVAQPSMIKRASFVLVPGVRPPVALPLPPQAPFTGTTVTTDPNEIYVLGFVCRLLPKSPDPDPALEW